MIDLPESPSIAVTADIISTAIVDTIYNVTLTNKTSDLPKITRKRQYRKRKSGLSLRKYIQSQTQ